MDARPERSACRRVRQRRGDDHSARRAAHRKAPVALDHWMDLGKFDGLVFACRLGGQVLRELGLATGALIRTVVDLPVERLAHGAGVALVAGLAPPGLALSRRSLRSVAGGFDDVRDVFSGRCSRSNRSISSSFDSRCKSPRSIPPRIQRQAPLARGGGNHATDALDALFARLDRAIGEAGYLPMSGQIMDATLVAAPRQGNTEDEKARIKAGESAKEIWKDEHFKARQKDTDARWTVKVLEGQAGRERQEAADRHCDPDIWLQKPYLDLPSPWRHPQVSRHRHRCP